MVGRVDGKVAFITGAARGQGRAHAVRLAEEGADIIGVDLCEQVDTVPYAMGTAADLRETVRRVEALGRRMIATQVDVRDFEALRAAVDNGVAQLGRLDIVSANAGIFSVGSMMEMSEQTWQDMIDINLTGAWHTAKAAIPQLIEGGKGGSVIITSSGAGFKGVPQCGHYASAKHGLVGLMRSLALELAPHFIRVNSIHPTSVDTEMIQNDTMYRLFLPDHPSPARDDYEVASRTIQALDVPWMETIDISNALLFLASDEARFITGVTLPVDGGFAIK